jgi:CpeT protein
MHFREEGDGKYIGMVEPGKKCFIPRDGKITYLVSEVEVDETNWISRDRGFDPESNQPKWGSEHGPLRFKRIESFSKLITSSWILKKEL